MRILYLLIALISSPLFSQISISISPNQGSGIPSDGRNSHGRNEPMPFERIGGERGRAHDEQVYIPSLDERPYERGAKLDTLIEAKDYFKGQVKRRNEVREQIKCMDRYEDRAEIVEYASESLRVSREHYLKDEFEEGKIAAQVADVLLDLATSLTPGVSWGRDLYEAVSGKDLHSGEELGQFTRSMAVLGVVTAGFGSKVGKACKFLGRLMKGDRAVDSLRAGEKILDSVKEIKRFGPLEVGPLHIASAGAGSVANTFRSGSYFEVTTKEPVKLYRVWSDGLSEFSAYWSRTKSTGPLQAQLDAALDPSWGNKATKWTEITVPSGETFYEGAVSHVILKTDGNKIATGSLLGGGSQVYINKRVPASWKTGGGDF
ncbi:MAG: pre-toxin TG domain-containing protein [Oligoflexales bacterium]|nr:pre-toxin TG domain-containing protein [Oligoflexales bacterium]